MCDSGKHWATHEGLATLDPLAVRLKDLLDASFLNIAARCRPSACNSRRC